MRQFPPASLLLLSSLAPACGEPSATCLPVPAAVEALRGGGWDANGRDPVEAAAKCVDWGYAPETVGEATFAACVRMVRADYCGDGTSWTVDGTWIDVGDPGGVQVPTGSPVMQFEAGWNAGGAVCVRTTRYAVEDAEGTQVLPPCWASLPRCEDRASAEQEGALVTSAVLHEAIGLCR